MPISHLLESIGFSDASLQLAARPVIEAAGYTNPRKINISTDKAKLVEAYIKSNFSLVCSPACAAALGKKRMRTQLQVEIKKCEFCNGSKQNKLLAKMAKDLFDQNLVDKVLAFISPIIIGGDDAKSPIGGSGIEFISESLHLKKTEVSYSGNDILVTGYIN